MKNKTIKLYEVISSSINVSDHSLPSPNKIRNNLFNLFKVESISYDSLPDYASRL